MSSENEDALAELRAFAPPSQHQPTGKGRRWTMARRNPAVERLEHEIAILRRIDAERRKAQLAATKEERDHYKAKSQEYYDDASRFQAENERLNGMLEHEGEAHMTAIEGWANAERELSALTAEAERMRGLLDDVVDEVDDIGAVDNHGFCPLCGALLSDDDDDAHAEDCVVTRIRSALAASAGEKP